MSAEETRREALRRDQEAIEGKTSTDRASKRNSALKHPQHGIPPMPDHIPPAPPVPIRSREGRETIEKATKEARRGATGSAQSEADVPDRILTTSVSPSDKHDGFQHEPILPVVEETAETSRNERENYKTSNFSGKGPITVHPPPTGPPPPTPPKDRPPPPPLKSDKAEQVPLSLQPKVSRESLNKNLPPLPDGEETHESTQDSGVRMV